MLSEVLGDQPVRAIGGVGVEAGVVHRLGAPQRVEICPVLQEASSDIRTRRDTSVTRDQHSTPPLVDCLQPGQARLVVAQRVG